jgi:hypothetical protein
MTMSDEDRTRLIQELANKIKYHTFIDELPMILVTTLLNAGLEKELIQAIEEVTLNSKKNVAAA